jgi:hypothetical protein
MPREPLAAIRTCLLGLLAFGTLAVSAELWLVQHFEDTNQRIPLVLAGMGLVAIALVAIRPRPATLRLLQFVMLCYAGGGVIGISLHHQANASQQREANPSLAGDALFWAAVRSTAPPALAPGVLIQLGLLGLIYCHRHPGLGEEPWPVADQVTRDPERP